MRAAQVSLEIRQRLPSLVDDKPSAVYRMPIELERETAPIAERWPARAFELIDDAAIGTLTGLKPHAQRERLIGRDELAAEHLDDGRHIIVGGERGGAHVGVVPHAIDGAEPYGSPFPVSRYSFRLRRNCAQA